MRSSSILALSGVALITCVLLAGCGGGGGGSNTTPTGPPTITSTTVSPATINVPYSFFLQASGGTGTYTWAITGGSLPTGVTLNSQTAQISGTPTVVGSFPFTAQVTDSKSQTGTANLTLVVGGAIVIACNSCASGTDKLPSGQPNVPYPPSGTPAALTPSDGNGSYTWCVLNSAGTCDPTQAELPPGLTISTDSHGNGIISGTPTTGGTPTQFTAQVSDTEIPPAVGTVQLTITIMGISPTTLPNGNINTPYAQVLSATGGAPNYTWSVISGTLPPGLTLGPCIASRTGNCNLGGTPTTIGTYPFTVKVSDGETPPSVATVAYSIDIQSPPLGVSTPSLPSGTQTLSYQAILQSTGGLAPLTWSITSGSLPTGLSLNASSGEISGTPTGAPGKTSFTVQVQDSESPPQTASAPLSITIAPAVSNSLLNGNYAIAFSGFDNGTPFMIAAAFIADGNGNITGGFLDLNNGSGETYSGNQVIPQTIQSGSSYSLNPNGTGTITIVTNEPATYKFSVAVNGNACVANSVDSDCGQLIQRDSSNPHTYGSGQLLVQDNAFFNLSEFFPGNFALQLTGIDPNGKPYGAVGALGFNPGTLVDIDCNANGWHLNACPLDTNDNGQASPDPINGTFASTIDGSTGRGANAIMSYQSDPHGYCLGTLASPACIYVYYIINKQEMILMSTDPIDKPANMTLWSAHRQVSNVTGWDLASLSGANVVQLSAINPNGGSPVTDVTAGILNSNGAGAGTFNSDENDGGTLNQQQSSQGTYAVSTTGKNTGQVTFSGFSQFGASGGVGYLFTGNLNGNTYAYLLGNDTNVATGMLEQQTGSPFQNASVGGSYAGGTVSPGLTSVTNSIEFIFADGAGDIPFGIQYTSGPNGVGGPNNLALSYSIDSTGRSVVKDQNGNTFGILYVIGPNKFVLLPSGSDPALSVFISGQAD